MIAITPNAALQLLSTVQQSFSHRCRQRQHTHTHPTHTDPYTHLMCVRISRWLNLLTGCAVQSQRGEAVKERVQYRHAARSSARRPTLYRLVQQRGDILLLVSVGRTEDHHTVLQRNKRETIQIEERLLQAFIHQLLLSYILRTVQTHYTFIESA